MYAYLLGDRNIIMQGNRNEIWDYGLCVIKKKQSNYSDEILFYTAWRKEWFLRSTFTHMFKTKLTPVSKSSNRLNFLLRHTAAVVTL